MMTIRTKPSFITNKNSKAHTQTYVYGENKQYNRFLFRTYSINTHIQRSRRAQLKSADYIII